MTAMSAATSGHDEGQVHGMSIFFDKAKCDSCHEGANFTLNMYCQLAWA